MPTLLEQLIQDHGDEITRKISGTLGVTREEAAGVLSATAPVILGPRESPSQGAERASTTSSKAPANR
jgi:hypothetical protein